MINFQNKKQGLISSDEINYVKLPNESHLSTRTQFNYLKIGLGIVVLIVLVVSFIILASYFVSSYYETSRKVDCFDCGKLKSFTLTETIATGTKRNCCISEEEIVDFLNQFTKFQIQSQLENEQPILETGPLDTTKSGSTRPLAHLAIDQAVPVENDRLLIHWLSPHTNNTFLKNGMTLYRRRYLRIPISGKYFVYSQVTFLGEDEDNKTSTCVHYIIRINSNGQRNDIKSGVLIDHELHEQSSYLGAAYVLNQGDFLAVQTSKCKLSTSEQSTFVGIFML